MAQLEIANNQYIALRSQEIRLIAERDGAPNLTFQSDLMSFGERALEETRGQIEIFNARRSALQGVPRFCSNVLSNSSLRLSALRVCERVKNNSHNPTQKN